MNSEYDDWDDDDQDGQSEEAALESQLPNPARKYLKKVQRELAEARKALDEKNALINQRTVKDVLANAGITHEKAAIWLRNDVEDLSDTAAVDKWIAENGALFGAEPRPLEPNPSEDEVGLQRIAQTQSQGAPTGNREQELQAAMRGTKDEGELMRILRDNGFS